MADWHPAGITSNEQQLQGSLQGAAARHDEAARSFKGVKGGRGSCEEAARKAPMYVVAPPWLSRGRASVGGRRIIAGAARKLGAGSLAAVHQGHQETAPQVGGTAAHPRRAPLL
jgi:hypothetical protein